ncbi:MAG: DUF2173 family protein [Burkholderiales bacterium]
MPTLDQLMSLPGVQGAIEFTSNGELSNMCGSLERNFAEIAAQMCAANMAIYRMQATAWFNNTGLAGFLPERGFAFMSLDHVMMGMDGKAVIGQSVDFDYDEAFRLFNDHAEAKS